MPVTEYTAHLIGDAIANGTAYQGPATIHLALVTTTPTATVAGTEVTLGSYARKSFAVSGFTNDAKGKLTNTADVSFVAATADYDDAVVAVEAYDAATSGNRLWYILLSTARLVVTGTVPKFLAGDLELQVV